MKDQRNNSHAILSSTAKALYFLKNRLYQYRHEPYNRCSTTRRAALRYYDTQPYPFSTGHVTCVLRTMTCTKHRALNVVATSQIPSALSAICTEGCK